MVVGEWVAPERPELSGQSPHVALARGHRAEARYAVKDREVGAAEYREFQLRRQAEKRAHHLHLRETRTSPQSETVIIAMEQRAIRRNAHVHFLEDVLHEELHRVVVGGDVDAGGQRGAVRVDEALEVCAHCASSLVAHLVGEQSVFALGACNANAEHE